MLYIAVFSDGQGARRERGARLYNSKRVHDMCEIGTVDTREL